MEHKDLWLVLGLTVILAVAVSISTVSLTGDAVSIFSAKKTTVQKAPIANSVTNLKLPSNCEYIQEFGDEPFSKYLGKKLSGNSICSDAFGRNYKCIGIAHRYYEELYSDSSCKTPIALDTNTGLEGGNACNGVFSLTELMGPSECNSKYSPISESYYWFKVSSVVDAVLCCK